MLYSTSHVWTSRHGPQPRANERRLWWRGPGCSRRWLRAELHTGGHGRGDGFSRHMEQDEEQQLLQQQHCCSSSNSGSGSSRRSRSRSSGSPLQQSHLLLGQQGGLVNHVQHPQEPLPGPHRQAVLGLPHKAKASLAVALQVSVLAGSGLSAACASAKGLPPTPFYTATHQSLLLDSTTPYGTACRSLTTFST